MYTFRDLLLNCDYNESRRVYNIIGKVQDETPFSAYGFFNIERSTLTTMMATILTYLIILVQFDEGEKSCA